MKEDLISIIILVYKVEQYLEQCIQSVMNQTYKKLEILLVYKDSDDNCLEICKKYVNIDKRFKLIYQKDKGVDAARKLGFKHASGKYIGYVDGDDWIDQDMYEKLHYFAVQYDVDVVESGFIDMWEDSDKKRVPYFPEGCYKEKLFEKIIEPKLLYTGIFFQNGISVPMWSKLFLKSKLEKYQMMQDLLNECMDDIMVSIPCIAQTKSIYITHNYYYHYRTHSENEKCKYRPDDGINLSYCYSDIFMRFKGTQLCKRGDKQIQYYLMYWLLARAPGIFDNASKEEFLFPYGCIERNSRIVLYGAGMCGKFLKRYIDTIQECELICWVDQHFESIKGEQNIVNPEKIIGLNYDYVIISILREEPVREVKRYLKQLEISSEKILWIDQKFINDPLLLLKNATCDGKSIFTGIEEYYI